MSGGLRIAAIGMMLGLSACNSAANRAPPSSAAVAAASPIDRNAALVRTTVKPAPFTTTAFRELGDSRRAAVARDLIQRVWGQDCQVVAISLRGYLSLTGDSSWRVSCSGSTRATDYNITFPQDRASGSRVHRCYVQPAGNLICDIFGGSGRAS